MKRPRTGGKAIKKEELKKKTRLSRCLEDAVPQTRRMD